MGGERTSFIPTEGGVTGDDEVKLSCGDGPPFGLVPDHLTVTEEYDRDQHTGRYCP